MMRNEYFSDGFFEGYDWTVAQDSFTSELSLVAEKANRHIASIPFTNGEDARQWREGFMFGIRSAFQNEPESNEIVTKGEDDRAECVRPAA